jgi:hypothetical protein
MKPKELNSYFKRKDISIEGNVATWNISAHGEILGLYAGAFKFKCFLTPIEKLAAGRLYRELLGTNATLALNHEDSLAFTLSQLKYRVVSGPPFWDSSLSNEGISQVPDENVLDIILEAALASEFKYIAMLRKKKDDVVEQAKQAAEKMLQEREASDKKE